MLQTPAKNFAVANWQQETWTGEFFRRTDQRLQVAIGFANCVPKETDDCRVTSYSTFSLDDGCRAWANRITQLTAAIVSVNVLANAIASLDVGVDRHPHRATRD